MIICIDFDETLVTTCYPEPPSVIIDGMKETLQWMKRRGHTLILWTCRTLEKLDEAREFCIANGLPLDYYNENTPEIIELYGRDNRKIYADLYIDDKNIGGLPSPEEIITLVYIKMEQMKGNLL